MFVLAFIYYVHFCFSVYITTKTLPPEIRQQGYLFFFSGVSSDGESLLIHFEELCGD